MKSLLVTLADKNYLDQAKQLFSSVYFNAGWQGDYMLLAHEIPEEDLAWFREKGILVKECEPLFHGKLVSGYPVTILDKFYLFTPEFKKWDNIVFLDADIIVRYPLDKLAKVRGFNAALDVNKIKLKHQFNYYIPNNLLYKNITKKYKINIRSFNVGVMAFSSDIINENTFNELKELLNSYEKISLYTEQTLLNLYFYKKWKKLSFVYNFYVTIWEEWSNHYRLNKKIIDSPILHFIGSGKPWVKNNLLYAEWKENLDKANLINLKKRNTTNLKIFKKNKIYAYIVFISNTIGIFYDFYYFIDRQIGKIGIKLKKYYPTFYFKLKKINLKQKK